MEENVVMSMQLAKWSPGRSILMQASSLFGVACLLNGCIFFGTEYCDLETDPSCVGGSGIGEGGGVGSGGEAGSGGGPSTGGTIGEAGGSGGSLGGTGGTGGSTGGSSTGGSGTGGGGTGGSSTGGSGTGGSGTGGSGTGELVRLWINETRTGVGSTWVELYNNSPDPIDLSKASLSSSGSASPNYAGACSLASVGMMPAGSYVMVVQYSPATCVGSPSPCVKGCGAVESAPGRFLQIFEDVDGVGLTLINARELPSPGPSISQTYQSPSDGQAGDFVSGQPSPGAANSP